MDPHHCEHLQWDLIPQHATDIVSFHEIRCQEKEKLPARPEAVVTIGILDTGVDPAIFHENPLVTLIDSIDCTSSGDVDVTDEVAVRKVLNSSNDSDFHYEVVGHTGRTLMLSKEWNIQPFPSAEVSTKEGDTEDNKLTVRLGMKRGYEFFPRALVDICRKNIGKQRQRELDLPIALLHQKLAEWNEENIKSGNNPSVSSIAERDDYLAQLEILQEFVNDSEDPGPVYDCVVFWDGSQYRTVIDMEEKGDLRSVKPLTSYGIEHEYGTFRILTTEDDVYLLNFVVQLFNDGKLLSIVTDCSPHGTHVAQIAATTASSGSSPSKVQLISFKIGDPRLGTMETGTSLIRAIQLASSVKYHCDVVNISYGEAVVHARSGQRFAKLVDDCVLKYNTVIVCAAGNHGPALTTVNAPGMLSSCISVGAVVTQSMREALYNMLPSTSSSVKEVSGGNESAPCDVYINDKVDSTKADNFETTYTWSSVGPTADGDWGVTVSAPGAAIASVPHWCLSKSQLMNGTSMACPHTTGCVALLIAACKMEGIPVSSARIRRAFENTSHKLPNLSQLEQGCGIIQVGKAWEYIQKNYDDVTENIRFDVEIVDPSFGDRSPPRGIYLRHPDACTYSHPFSVRVTARFLGDDVVAATQSKLNLQLDVSLESQAPWIRTAGKFVLTNATRTFDIEVDPSTLCPGLHCASVVGYFVGESNRKLIFSVPVTVTKPLLPVRNSFSLGELNFGPAEIKRFFVVPPIGSTCMNVILRDTRDSISDVTSRAVALHIVQLLPHSRYSENERNMRLNLAPGQTHVSAISVEPNVVCEIVVARYWSTRQATTVDVTVHFRGIRPVPKEVNMISGSGGSIVRVYNDLAYEVISPSGNLTTWQVPIRPLGDCCITPVRDDRDLLLSEHADAQSYQLVLTYKFEQEEKGSFMLRAPALQGVLYESAYESQSMLLFDGEKRFIGMSDAYPSSITAAKGPITIRLQIRHKDPCQLEKLKCLVIWIERKLAKEIPLSLYSTRECMLLGSGSFEKHTMRKGLSLSVFFSEPEYSKLPASCAPGHRLLGVLSFVPVDTKSQPGAGICLGGFAISYFVGPNPIKPSAIEVKASEPTSKPSMEKKMTDAMLDLQIEYLGKIADSESGIPSFDKRWQNLTSQYPDNLSLCVAKLKYLDGRPERMELLPDIVLASKAVISLISEESLAQGLGRNVDSENGNSVQDHKELSEKRDFLVDALARMALALSETAQANPVDKDSTVSFDETVRQIKSWVNLDSSPKLPTLRIAIEMRAARYGLALKQINKILEDPKENDSAIRPMARSELIAMKSSIYEKLGLDVLISNNVRMQAMWCPKSYAPF